MRVHDCLLCFLVLFGCGAEVASGGSAEKADDRESPTEDPDGEDVDEDVTDEQGIVRDAAQSEAERLPRPDIGYTRDADASGFGRDGGRAADAAAASGTRDAGARDGGRAVGPSGSSEAGVGMPALDPEASSAPLTRRTVRVGAATRSFILHVPSTLPREKPAPFVIVFHGFTMSGELMSTLTSWTKVADREGVIVAFPDGDMTLGPLSSPWNVGTNVCNVGAFVANQIQDDVGFVDALIADVNGVRALDEQRIFAAGFSMGGYLTNHLACQRSRLFRAVAPHSGGTYADGCPADYRPLPVLVLHGTADGLIPYACGSEAKDYWLTRNGCSRDIASTETVKGGKCEFYRGCEAQGDVGMCTFDGMKHGWAGSDGLGLPFDYAGGTTFDDGAEVIWKFFEQHL
jgi:polyhydroxybutyrate depolymerase